MLRSFEHVCAVLLQALAPVIKVTYAVRASSKYGVSSKDRVAKESRPKKAKKEESDSEEATTLS